MRYSKYRAKKTELDGIKFDSKHEAEVWSNLKLLERAHEISDLQRQVKFELIPKQIRDGKTVERACSYIADFVYRENGEKVVADAKGMKTPVYKIKKKLMLWRYGIKIKEL